ncbi:MAG: beta-ketoacyl-ACP synthase II [Thermodesulfovibrionia bacterium]|nr:beta-ketoacyl-ACP synthase II [Thermodesulfovibrionia bacterium]
MKRVVITGIGVVTPLGNNIRTTWENLTKGLSGITPITKFDPRSAAFPSKIAGELKSFSTEDYIPPKDVLRLDPFIYYAAAAAIMAVEDAGLISRGSGVRGQGLEKQNNSELITHNSELFNLFNSAIVIGSSRGGIMSMEKAMEKYILDSKPFSAFLMSSTTINMASSYVSMRLGIKGPVLGISTACASGTNAIGEAFRLIQYGEIDMALTGGSEAPICKLTVGSYGAAGALSKRNHEPQKASRPFDKDRDGFVIAEGAGILVLEELRHALKRGARIYAELSGYGTSSDAFHQTKPDSSGQAIAINKALKDAGVSVDEVDYINAHATSTIIGDKAETEAIRKVFGKYADKIAVSSTKSMLGHMLGASGAVEAAITALSISKGVIIPTINLETPVHDCKLNHVTTLLHKEIKIAISNSFGFGGVNAVLALKKFES